jgi:hypothetical protein
MRWILIVVLILFCVSCMTTEEKRPRKEKEERSQMDYNRENERDNFETTIITW